MKICVIGTGYVGLVIGACLSNIGHKVICSDKDKNKILNLKKGIMPIYEPGLKKLIISNIKKKNLFFTSDLSKAITLSKICYIAVGTPKDQNGDCDIKNVIEVVKEISKYINEYKIIINKSTVPVGTVEKLEEIIKSKTKADFDIVSNPEFLKQGSAVKDFMKPERIIIGSNSEKAIKTIREIYKPFLKVSSKFIVTDTKSAEMIKYVANSFLATKISFINEIANLCEKVGANIHDIKLGISSDSRIGKQFLHSGIGYGGSCFPKDIRAIIKTGEQNGFDMKIISSVEKVNKLQKKLFVNKILEKFDGNIENKIFAVWGLSYKPKTNDMREAPSIYIINDLIQKGANIQAFDPKAMSNAKEIFKNKIIYCKNCYEALKGADALILLTEWNEFKKPDFLKIKTMLKNLIIFDGRNLYNKKELITQGFDYVGVGV